MSGDRGHVFFGALKFLQDRIPIETYAIIDRCDRTKNFFKNQNFVNFKKIYFYRDSVKPLHSPDLGYLKKFEEKHKLNLWQIAFSDPTFYTFNGKSKFSDNQFEMSKKIKIPFVVCRVPNVTSTSNKVEIFWKFKR